MVNILSISLVVKFSEKLTLKSPKNCQKVKIDFEISKGVSLNVLTIVDILKKQVRRAYMGLISL